MPAARLEEAAECPRLCLLPIRKYPFYTRTPMNLLNLAMILLTAHAGARRAPAAVRDAGRVPRGL